MGFLDIFTAKQRRLQEMIKSYMDTWDSCIQTFRDAWEVYLQEGNSENFAYKVDATHKKESDADNVRRKLEHELYSKALLPESRGDILTVVESVDTLAGVAEDVLFEICLQNLELPDELVPNLNKMIDLSCQSCSQIKLAVMSIFVHNRKSKDILDIFDRIDELESECDHVERRLIRAIFKMDITMGQKMLYKSLVREISAITDKAERVADRLSIISVKRRV